MNQVSLSPRCSDGMMSKYESCDIMASFLQATLHTNAALFITTTNNPAKLCSVVNRSADNGHSIVARNYVDTNFYEISFIIQTLPAFCRPQNVKLF